MPYKDKDKAREYAREAMRRKRQGITRAAQDVIPNVIPALRAYSKDEQTSVRMTKKQAEKREVLEMLKKRYDYRG